MKTKTKTATKTATKTHIDLVLRARLAERGSAGSAVRREARIVIFGADQQTPHPDSEKIVEDDLRGTHEYYNRLVRAVSPKYKKARGLVVGPEARKQELREKQISALYQERHDCAKSEEARINEEILKLKQERRESWALVDKERTALRKKNAEKIQDLIGPSTITPLIKAERNRVSVYGKTRQSSDPTIGWGNYTLAEKDFGLATRKAFNLKSIPHFRGEDRDGTAPEDFRAYKFWQKDGTLRSDFTQKNHHAHRTPEAIFGGKGKLMTIRPFEESDLAAFNLPAAFWDQIARHRSEGKPDRWYVILIVRNGTKVPDADWYGVVANFPAGSKQTPSLLDRLRSVDHVTEARIVRKKQGLRLETHVNLHVKIAVAAKVARETVEVSWGSFTNKGVGKLLVTYPDGRVDEFSEANVPALLRCRQHEETSRKLHESLSKHEKDARKAFKTLNLDPSIIWDREEFPRSPGSIRHVYRRLFRDEMVEALGGEAAREKRDEIMRLCLKLYRQPGPDGEKNPYGGDPDQAREIVAMRMAEIFPISEDKAAAMAVVFVFMERFNHLADWAHRSGFRYHTSRREFYRTFAAELCQKYNVTYLRPPKAGRKVSGDRSVVAPFVLETILKTAALKMGRAWE